MNEIKTYGEMYDIEELCRQVVKFIPDNTQSSSTEFNRPYFAAKTTVLLAADEIARLTAENERLRAENEKLRRTVNNV